MNSNQIEIFAHFFPFLPPLLVLYLSIVPSLYFCATHRRFRTVCFSIWYVSQILFYIFCIIMEMPNASICLYSSSSSSSNTSIFIRESVKMANIFSSFSNTVGFFSWVSACLCAASTKFSRLTIEEDYVNHEKNEQHEVRGLQRRRRPSEIKGRAQINRCHFRSNYRNHFRNGRFAVEN